MNKKIMKIVHKVCLMIISFLIFASPINSSDVCASSGDLGGVLNGFVNSGFTNKVNNPKYNIIDSNGETIDPTSGQLTIRQTDIVFSGRDGLDLEVSRIYNSSPAEIMKKKAIYYITEFYLIDEQAWSYSDGQYIPAPKTPRPYKYSTLEEAEAEYLKLYFQWCMTSDKVNDYGIYFDAYNGDTVLRTYAPRYSYEETKGSGLTLENYLVDRFDLGVGWSFAFPSIENSNGYYYYHDGNGGTYRINNNTLENYDDKDLTITNTQGKYVFNYNNSRIYTFTSEGVLEKINDQYGNRIKFEYIYRPVYNKLGETSRQKPFISKIVDSIGREIDFEYQNNINGGDNGATDLITVHVTDPITNVKTKVIEYVKIGVRTSLQDTNGAVQYEFNFPYLDCVKRYKDSLNYESTWFRYESMTEEFDFWKKELSGTRTSKVLLSKIIEQNLYSTTYEYEKCIQNLGNDGAVNEARCKKRYDILFDRRYKDPVTNTWKWNTGNEQKMNLVEFEYSPMSYTGYPNFTSEENILNGREIWSIGKNLTGINVKTTHRYNSQHKRKQLYEVKTIATDGTSKKIVNELFDTRFPSKPIVVCREYNSKEGHFLGSYHTFITYNDFGYIESQTQPIIFYNYGDETYKEKRKTIYEYEPTYKKLAKKTWWQNETTQLYEEYSYDSLGRLKTERNAKGEITQHDYQVVSSALYSGESNVSVVTKETITKALENGKQAKKEIIYEANKGSLPVQIINYFSDDTGTKQTNVTMAYDMLMGLLKTQTEQGHTTTYNYDFIGRVTSIVKPSYTDIDGKIYSVVENYKYTPTFSYQYKESASESCDGLEYEGLYGLLEETDIVYTSNGVENKYAQQKNFYDAYGNLRYSLSYDPKKGSWIQTKKNIYDTVPRLIATIDGTNNKTTCEYNVEGSVSEVTDPYNNLYVTEKVNQKLFVDYFVPADKVSSYRQNPSYTNPDVKYILESHYNTSELLEKRVAYRAANMQQKVEEFFYYDIVGNLVGYIDPMKYTNEDGNTKTIGYDELNRLKMVKNALNQVADINYTLGGEIESIYARDNALSTDKKEIYIKSYNEAGNLNNKTVNSQLKSQTVYNESGLIQRSKYKELNTTEYSYDELNMLKQLDLMDSAGVLKQRTKYLHNNPFGISEIRTSDDTMIGSINEKVTFGYNYDGQVEQKQVDFMDNGVLRSLIAKSEFNNLGQTTRTSISGFESSYVTNYEYEKTRLKRAQLDGIYKQNFSDSTSATFNYYSDGRVDTIQYPVYVDGSYLTAKHIYNPMGQIESVTNSTGSSVLSSESYQYNNNGNIIKIIQKIKSSGNYINNIIDYTYDKLNRLKMEKITKDGIVITYKIYNYDLLGNRDTAVDEPATYNFTTNEKEQVTSMSNISSSNSTYKYGQDGLRYQKAVQSEPSIYLSDLEWASANCGWGEVKKDKSVSGGTITLKGSGGNVTYSKGLGTHAESTIIYNLNGQYSSFMSDIGVDRASINSPADVEFKVYGDGKEIYNSGVMYSWTDKKTISVSVLGVNELKLVVTGGNNGIASDHANWADARLLVSQIYLSDLEWASANSGWGEVKKDKSVSGGTITLKGSGGNVTYSKGLGTHAESTIIYNLNGQYSSFMSDIGVDVASINTVAQVEFKVYGDGKEIYNSGVVHSGENKKTISVSVLGVNELKLVVTGGNNGIASDHANWADARLLASHTTTYGYDESGNLTQVNNGGTTDQFIWANGKVYAKKDGNLNKTYYYLYNALGDVLQLVDSSGTIVNSYTYDAWGKPTLKQETVTNPFRYRGYVYDDETGLYYLKARYYSWAKGKFLTEDTYEGKINDIQSMNLTAYCNNNPVMYKDPSGNICIVPLLLKAGAGGAADFLIQATMNYFFNPETAGDIGESIGAVNWWQVARSAGEALIPWKVPGGRLGKAAASAAGDVLVNAMHYGSNYSAEQAIQDFAVGFIGDLAGGGIGELIDKYGVTALRKGLKNMKFSDDFISKMLCFTADTEILTKDGYKPIQEIREGDEVYSQNPETGEKGLKKVRQVFVNETNILIHVFISDEEIETTTEHPFWVEGRGWVAASNLEIGNKLLMYSGEIVEVTAVTKEILSDPVKVYNFEVEDWHTYFVSGTDVLVHNKCGWTSKTTSRFWDSYNRLPKNIREAADAAFKRFKENPDHPGLNFEHIRDNLYSARINQQYRAYGLDKGDGVIEWFYINAHDYNEVYRMLGWR